MVETGGPPHSGSNRFRAPLYSSMYVCMYVFIIELWNVSEFVVGALHVNDCACVFLVFVFIGFTRKKFIYDYKDIYINLHTYIHICICMITLIYFFILAEINKNFFLQLK